MRYRSEALGVILFVFPCLLLLGTSHGGAVDAEPCIQEEGAEENEDSPDTDKAIAAGLRWLANHQEEDGNWDADDFGMTCGEKACAGSGFEYWDGGVTGLALLAYIRAGHTHKKGKYREVVKKGLDWLLEIQVKEAEPKGAIGFEMVGDRPKEEWVYNHAIATTTLCEAYAATRDETLLGPAKHAVSFCVQAQNPHFGWRYGIRSGDNDTSVTTWMVKALSSARAVGIEVPPTAFEGPIQWYNRATSQSGATGYRAPDGSSSFLPMQQGKYDAVPCMTATAIAGRALLGQETSTPVIKKGVRLLRESLPAWPDNGTRQVNLYYWYYGARAMRAVGEEDQRLWNGSVQEALLPHQRKEGHEAGSWDPVGEWGVAGGRVYATAIAVLTLEVTRKTRRFY